MSLSYFFTISFDFQGFDIDFNFTDLYDKYGSYGGTCFVFAMFTMLVCYELLFVCSILNLFVMNFCLNCKLTHT